jgi:hypothetical protein
MIDSKLGQEREEKAKQEAAKASALEEMFAKIEEGRLCTCTMPVLPDAIEKSLQMGKTPLLLDHTVVSGMQTHPCCEISFTYDAPAGLPVENLGFQVSGFGFRVSGFGFRVLGFGFWVKDFGFQVSGFGRRVPGLGFRV